MWTDDGDGGRRVFAHGELAVWMRSSGLMVVRSLRTSAFLKSRCPMRPTLSPHLVLDQMHDLADGLRYSARAARRAVNRVASAP